MEERTTPKKYRARLWAITGEMGLSNSTDLKISELMNNSEQNAKEILQKIEGLKTEAEVKRALNL